MKKRTCGYCGRDISGTKYRKSCGEEVCVAKKLEERKKKVGEVERIRSKVERDLNAKTNPRHCDYCGNLLTGDDNRRLPVCRRDPCQEWWKGERVTRRKKSMAAANKRERAKGRDKYRAPVEVYFNLRPDDFTHQRYLEQQRALKKTNGWVCQWDGCGAELVGNDRIHCKRHQG